MFQPMVQAMFQTIVVCTDGSDDAQHAALLAVAIALPMKAEVVVLNALDIAAMTTPYAAAPETLSCVQVLIESAEQGQSEAVNRTSELLTKAGLTCRVRREMGQPIHTIMQVAEEEKAGLIILGSHGLTGLKKFFLGSISDGVVRYAHCPVLIVRGETTQIQRILLASDGSDDSEKATCIAAGLARALSAELTVVHVVEAGKPSLGISPDGLTQADYNSQLDRVMQQYVDHALHGTHTGGPSTDCRICQLQGHPAEMVTKYAEDHGTDLIVVGSRGLGGFQRLLMGSVSDAIVHHANCPVLVVR